MPASGWGILSGILGQAGQNISGSMAETAEQIPELKRKQAEEARKKAAEERVEKLFPLELEKAKAGLSTDKEKLDAWRKEEAEKEKLRPLTYSDLTAQTKGHELHVKGLERTEESIKSAISEGEKVLRSPNLPEQFKAPLQVAIARQNPEKIQEVINSISEYAAEAKHMKEMGSRLREMSGTPDFVKDALSLAEAMEDPKLVRGVADAYVKGELKDSRTAEERNLDMAATALNDGKPIKFLAIKDPVQRAGAIELYHRIKGLLPEEIRINISQIRQEMSLLRERLAIRREESAERRDEARAKREDAATKISTIRVEIADLKDQIKNAFEPDKKFVLTQKRNALQRQLDRLLVPSSPQAGVPQAPPQQPKALATSPGTIVLPDGSKVRVIK